jgi:hypothetical protein
MEGSFRSESRSPKIGKLTSRTLLGQAPAGNRAVTKDGARLWATPTQDSGVLTP